MGIKTFFKSLFKSSTDEEEIKEPPKEEIKEKNWDTKVCIYCQKEIGTEKKRYANGKLFHKKCFKKAERDFINGKLVPKK